MGLKKPPKLLNPRLSLRRRGKDAYLVKSKAPDELEVGQQSKPRGKGDLLNWKGKHTLQRLLGNTVGSVKTRGARVGSKRNSGGARIPGKVLGLPSFIARPSQVRAAPHVIAMLIFWSI